MEWTIVLAYVAITLCAMVAITIANVITLKIMFSEKNIKKAMKRIWKIGTKLDKKGNPEPVEPKENRKEIEAKLK